MATPTSGASPYTPPTAGSTASQSGSATALGSFSAKGKRKLTEKTKARVSIPTTGTPAAATAGQIGKQWLASASPYPSPLALAPIKPNALPMTRDPKKPLTVALNALSPTGTAASPSSVGQPASGALVSDAKLPEPLPMVDFAFIETHLGSLAKVKEPTVEWLRDYVIHLGMTLQLQQKESSMHCLVGLSQLILMLLCGMDDPEEQWRVLVLMKLIQPLEPASAALMSDQKDHKTSSKDEKGTAAQSSAASAMDVSTTEVPFPASLNSNQKKALRGLIFNAARVQQQVMQSVSKLGVNIQSHVALAAKPQMAGSLNKEFIKGLSDYLNGSVLWQDSSGAALRQWISTNIPDPTLRNMIDSLIPPLLNEWQTADATLTHVFSFEAFWRKAFELGDESIGTFYCENGTKIPCYTMTGTFPGMKLLDGDCDGIKYTRFEVPYSQSCNYVGFCPNNPSELTALLRVLPKILAKEPDKSETTRLTLAVREGKTTNDLKDLAKLGYPPRASLGYIGPKLRLTSAGQMIAEVFNHHGHRMVAVSFGLMAKGGLSLNPRKLMVDCHIGVVMADVGARMPLAMFTVRDGKFLKKPNDSLSVASPTAMHQSALPVAMEQTAAAPRLDNPLVANSTNKLIDEMLALPYVTASLMKQPFPISTEVHQIQNTKVKVINYTVHKLKFNEQGHIFCNGLICMTLTPFKDIDDEIRYRKDPMGLGLGIKEYCVMLAEQKGKPYMFVKSAQMPDMKTSLLKLDHFDTEMYNIDPDTPPHSV